MVPPSQAALPTALQFQSAGLTRGALIPRQAGGVTPGEASALAPRQAPVGAAPTMLVPPRQGSFPTAPLGPQVQPAVNTHCGLIPSQAGSVAPGQSGGFIPTQAGGVPLGQSDGLTPGQAGGLTPRQAGVWSPAPAGGLTPRQAGALIPAQAGRFTQNQTGVFTPGQANAPQSGPPPPPKALEGKKAATGENLLDEDDDKDAPLVDFHASRKSKVRARSRRAKKKIVYPPTVRAACTWFILAIFIFYFS